MGSYRDLQVWQRSMELVVQIYGITERFPAQERYGLTQQMRRAAISIPSNLAEGHGRRTARQRYAFLETTLGSIFELETQIELAHRLQFVGQSDAEAVAETVRGIGRGLTALMRHVAGEARTEGKRHT